jgi:hypothetical protein
MKLPAYQPPLKRAPGSASESVEPGEPSRFQDSILLRAVPCDNG